MYRWWKYAPNTNNKTKFHDTATTRFMAHGRPLKRGNSSYTIAIPRYIVMLTIV